MALLLIIEVKFNFSLGFDNTYHQTNKLKNVHVIHCTILLYNSHPEPEPEPKPKSEPKDKDKDRDTDKDKDKYENKDKEPEPEPDFVIFVCFKCHF